MEFLKKLYAKLNQSAFAIALCAAAAVLGYFAQQLTGDNLQIVAVKVINAALIMVIPSAFIHFLRGTKYDIYEEIFVQHNIAAAIFVGLAWLSFALGVTVNS